jgi:hypothetical protein
LLCPAVIIILTGGGIQMSISNRIRDDSALSVLLGKKTWARLKRKGTFWSEDFDDLKKSLKISDRKRQRSAIDVARTEALKSVSFQSEPKVEILPRQLL